MLIAVGAFIVGLSSLISADDCSGSHRLPPYTPPRKPLEGMSAQHSDGCLGDAPCIPNWLLDDLTPGMSEPFTEGSFMPDLSASFAPRWSAWAISSRENLQAESCSIGHEPLLGNACVIAAQVRFLDAPSPLWPLRHTPHKHIHPQPGMLSIAERVCCTHAEAVAVIAAVRSDGSKDNLVSLAYIERCCDAQLESSGGVLWWPSHCARLLPQPDRQTDHITIFAT